MTLGNRRKIGRYRVERPLGSGGYATVWLAHDEELDGLVAIKVLADNWALNEDITRRFLDEARILRRLDHERIVEVHTIDRMDDGRPYFVMEYADGGSLRERIDTRTAAGRLFAPAEAVAIAREIAACLTVAHHLDVVHRDLKPSNILFRSVPVWDRGSSDAKPERMLLADFGIARRLSALAGKTISGGTPQYMAPEQADTKSAAAVDQRADLYAAAVILYELLTGETPFSAPPLSPRAVDTALDGLRTKANDSSWPSDLVGAIVRGLAVDPDHRWQSAHDWSDALASAMRSGSAAGTATANPPPPDAIARTQSVFVGRVIERLLGVCSRGLSVSVNEDARRELERIASRLEAPLDVSVITVGAVDRELIRAAAEDLAGVYQPARDNGVAAKSRAAKFRLWHDAPGSSVVDRTDDDPEAFLITVAPDAANQLAMVLDRLDSEFSLVQVRSLVAFLGSSESAAATDTRGVPAVSAHSAGLEAAAILRQALDDEFAARAATLKAHTAIPRLERVLEGDARLTDLLDELEDVLLSTPELAEIEVLAADRGERLRLPPDLDDDLRRVLGENDSHARLGVPADASLESLKDAAARGAERWRRIHTSGGGRREQHAAQVVMAAYRRLWHEADSHPT